MESSVFERIADKLAAGVTVGVSVASCEEQATLEKIVEVVAPGLAPAEQCDPKQQQGFPVYTYDLAMGLRKLAYTPGVGIQLVAHGLDWDKGSPIQMVQFIRDYVGRGLFILIDCQKILSELPMMRMVKVCTDTIANNPEVSSFRRLMFLGENIQFDNELDGRAEAVRIGRPDQDEIMAEVKLQVMRFQKSRNNFQTPPYTDQAFWTAFVRAASALHRREIVNIMCECAVVNNAIDSETIAALQAYKTDKLKAMGVEVAQAPKNEMGGYDLLQTYLEQQALLMQPDEDSVDDDPPKGILVAGPSGTGKSLVAKLTGKILGIPVFAFKMSSILDKFVGGSENKMKAILEMAEAAAPVVLWIDEIEKAFAGVSGEGHDSGVGKRVFGQFLTWMQEKSGFVYVVATANDVANLPPELLRAGRFDEIFRVDLPTKSEREKILAIHLTKHGTNTGVNAIAAMCQTVAAHTDRFSGAELEGIVTQAKNMARLRRQRGLIQSDDLLTLAQTTTPLAKKKAADLERMRESWKDFKAASSAEDAPVVSMGRGGAMPTVRVQRRVTKQ